MQLHAQYYIAKGKIVEFVQRGNNKQAQSLLQGEFSSYSKQVIQELMAWSRNISLKNR